MSFQLSERSHEVNSITRKYFGGKRKGLCIAIRQGVAFFVGLTLFALPNKVSEILPHFWPVDVFRGVPKVPISAMVSLVVDLAHHEFPKCFAIDTMSFWDVETLFSSSSGGV